MSSVKIIAEIGINHNGDIDIAKRLIDIAVVAGCDYVKFQKRTPDICVPEAQKNKVRSTPWGEMRYIDYKEYLDNKGREIPEQEQEFYGTNAIHWQEFCKHPWMSMTVKSDGEIHMCMEDYNNEIFLGNANQKNLKEIWNDKLYEQFRQDHFDLNPCIKCNKECDMPKIGGVYEI